jgi:hypothetical protein
MISKVTLSEEYANADQQKPKIDAEPEQGARVRGNEKGGLEQDSKRWWIQIQTREFDP